MLVPLHFRRHFWVQMTTLIFINFSQGVMLTEPFTLSVYMVRHFLKNELQEGQEIDEQVVGRLTGLLAAVFSLAQFTTSLLWGSISNMIGRKPVIVIGTAVSIVSMISYGMAETYTAAVIARIIGGLLNGVLGAWKCIIGESGDSLVQGRMFGYMSVAWGMGTTLGPIIGGALARPCEHYSSVPLCEPGQLFYERPFALPCIVGSTTIFISLLATSFLLIETLPAELREQRVALLKSRFAAVRAWCARVCGGAAATPAPEPGTITEWVVLTKQRHHDDIVKPSGCRKQQAEDEHQSLLSSSRTVNGICHTVIVSDDPIHTSSWVVKCAAPESDTSDHAQHHQQDQQYKAVEMTELVTSGSSREMSESASAGLLDGGTRLRSHSSSGSSSMADQRQQHDQSDITSKKNSPAMQDHPVAVYIQSHSDDPVGSKLPNRMKAAGLNGNDKPHHLQIYVGDPDNELKDTQQVAAAAGLPVGATQETEGLSQANTREFKHTDSCNDRMSALRRNASRAVFTPRFMPFQHRTKSPEDDEMPDTESQHLLREASSQGVEDHASAETQTNGSSTVKKDTCQASNSDTQPLTPWYKNKQIVRTITGYTLVAFCYCAMDELLPIFAAATSTQGGLGLSEQQLAPSLAVYGITLMVYSAWFYSRMQKAFGTLRLSRAGLVAGVLCCITLPLAHTALRASWGLSQVVLYASMVLKSFAQGAAFTGALVMVNAAPHQSQLGTVNGIGQTLAALVRGLGPAIGGLLWSASLSLRIPGQQYIPFLCVSIIAMAAYGVFGLVALPKLK